MQGFASLDIFFSQIINSFNGRVIGNTGILEFNNHIKAGKKLKLNVYKMDKPKVIK